jgi:hypothetical protein
LIQTDKVQGAKALTHLSSSQTTISVTYSLSMDTSYASLQELERRIYKNVLKHTVINQTWEQKQLEFSETCFAIKEIISLKLYRHYSTNLEQYFLKKFNVSRAQVFVM